MVLDNKPISKAGRLSTSIPADCADEKEAFCPFSKTPGNINRVFIHPYFN